MHSTGVQHHFPRFARSISMKRIAQAITAASVLSAASFANAQQVVELGSLTCAGQADFSDVTGGSPPGTNYDNVLISGGLEIGERFTGQTLAFNGDFDVLGSSASSPLSLEVGFPNANLSVADLGLSNMLLPLGEDGFPNATAAGEGSFAVLFPTDQSGFSLDVLNLSGSGNTIFNFFRADGSLIETISINADPFNGNADTIILGRPGGEIDIAGVSVHNSSSGGLLFDNFCYDQLPSQGVSLEKTLLAGPTEVGIWGTSSTSFVFKVAYNGPDALIVDRIPADFDLLGCVASDGTVEITSEARKPGKGATRIHWQVSEGASDLTCEITTRQKPGNSGNGSAKGAKKGKKFVAAAYRPLSCGEFTLNEGATAYEIDPLTGDLVYEEVIDPDSGLPVMVPVVVVGPSNGLTVDAVAGGKDCSEASESQFPGLSDFQVLQDFSKE